MSFSNDLNGDVSKGGFPLTKNFLLFTLAVLRQKTSLFIPIYLRHGKHGAWAIFFKHTRTNDRPRIEERSFS
ncbi:MAG: hypothetical protein SFZ03_11225 [Candidatus Melainabacteria bacterium]|nr:hypothetical protein [Candidatus Melainabacteria bacterium]